MNYASVAILKKPGAFDDPLTYIIPSELMGTLAVGHGVLVPLKDTRQRGIVVDVHDSLPEGIGDCKEILELIPELFIYPIHVQLARKISDYYRCSFLKSLKLMISSHLWKGTGKRLLKQVQNSDLSTPNGHLFPLKPFKHELNTDQKRVLEALELSNKPVLLHGVTGSGKTEIYLRRILDFVRGGKQAILLLPEIALTPQMIDYFSAAFGEHLAVFHSKLSDGERLSQWLRVRGGQARLVIGSRSAIFAPVADLGLIIVDEEHEWTYKQESSPHYQIHQVAEMLSELTGCQLIFGTATPRIETLYKTRLGQYDYLQLSQRINQAKLPQVEVVDLREEFKKKNYGIFSHSLLNKIKDRLERREQVILFVNQRGVARAVMCRDCGLAALCPNCEVTLKLHNPTAQISGTLFCHYCGYQAKPSLVCSHCQSVNIRHVGIGTQRVEQELLKAFPGVRVIRADADTTSDKNGFQPIYEAFKNRDFDVLVGTQMVAKGHDFPGVTLIGLILADIGLHIPDFRSHERLFQLITQVSGRAGRGDRAGEVVLQTYQPNHPAIAMAAEYRYEDFADAELKFRQKLNYPPFQQLVKFTVLGPDLEKLKSHLQAEKELMEDIFKLNHLSAKILTAPAMIPKVGEFYQYHVLIRVQTVSELFDYWKPPKGWRVDIDPIHTA